MATNEPNGDDRSEPCPSDEASAMFPGRMVKFYMTAAQLSYLRTLLFEDLKSWAEMIADNAEQASTTGGIAGIDSMEAFRGRPTVELLDLIGWDTTHDVEYARWLEKQARENLTIVEQTAVYEAPDGFDGRDA